MSSAPLAVSEVLSPAALTVRQTHLYEPFLAKSHHFAKTGSGHT
eukprot:COSAG06_NODE_304_length_17855_cov_47.399414_16_plen_44_part_00